MWHVGLNSWIPAEKPPDYVVSIERAMRTFVQTEHFTVVDFHRSVGADTARPYIEALARLVRRTPPSGFAVNRLAPVSLDTGRHRVQRNTGVRIEVQQPAVAGVAVPAVRDVELGVPPSRTYRTTAAPILRAQSTTVKCSVCTNVGIARSMETT
jgi:hypothetical protein